MRLPLLAGVLARIRDPLGSAVLMYGLAFAIAGATPLLLLPFLTQHLSPQQFGEVTAFLILTSLLANVAGLSAHGFVSVRYFKAPAAEFKGVVSSSIVSVFAVHAFVALLVALLYPTFGQALGLSRGYAMLAVAAAFALNLNSTFLAIFQSSGKPLLYVRARAVQASIEIGLCLALLLFVVASPGARVYSYIAALAVSAGIGLIYGLRNGIVGPPVQRTAVKHLMRFGVPMLPHIVAGSAIAYLDRVIVSTLLGVESLGIYMVASQIGMVMMALIEPLNKALAPWLFGQLAQNDAALRQRIVRSTYLLHGALALTGLVVVVVSQAMFDVFIDARYSAAIKLIPWMVAGFVLQGMYYSVVNYLFYAERTGRLSLMSATAAVTGCVVSYALTSWLGLLGAAMSFALNAAMLFVLVWLAAAKAVPMPWLRPRVAT